MRAILLAVLVALGAPSAHAQRSAAEELVSMAVNPSTPLGKPQRVQLTQTLITYCKDVLAALPTNTPAEASWVTGEMKTTDANKINRLMSSREYARHSLKDTFQTCVTGATRLLAEQNRNSAAKIGRFEAANYVSLAVNFNSGEDIETFAKRANLDINQFRIDFMGAIRRLLLFASLRALEE
jgi:hypothetical protein